MGKFTGADYRMLVLTFGGTIAANLVTAALIGLSISLGRL